MSGEESGSFEERKRLAEEERLHKAGRQTPKEDVRSTIENIQSSWVIESQTEDTKIVRTPSGRFLITEKDGKMERMTRLED